MAPRKENQSNQRKITCARFRVTETRKIVYLKMTEQFGKENLDPLEQTEIFFEDKERDFFIKIGLHVREAFKMHKDKEAGDLWGRKDSQKDWRNVSEHCLVEAARAEVFAEKLELSGETKNNLIIAVALHDFYKKHEIEKAGEEGLSFESMVHASEEASKILKKRGFSKKIIRLVGSVGADSLIETEEILKKQNLTEEDIAFLILHFIDDYSTGSDWVEAGTDALGIRIDKAEANPKYKLLNEQGREYFNGETSFEAQRRVGNLVQDKIANLMKERGMTIDDSSGIPYMVDQEIKNKIESENT